MPAAPTIPLSIYIHIPWCVRKCPYCDFNSHEAGNSIDEQGYVDALMQDLNSEVRLVGNREVQSVFFGGGTPSLFSPNAIHKIITELHNQLNIKHDAEITMEANPGTFEQNNFSDFKVAGVNRLSIGIQSFDDINLKNIGRIHDSKQALSSINTALTAGFENINLDLMFGLPEQSIKQAVNDIALACDQGIQHISHYQLTIEPNTYFNKHPPTTPDSDLLWDMQQQCHEILYKHGFMQYEVSAFAQQEKQCKHNLNYWRFGDYIGIGAGAHGKISANNKITRRWKRRQPGDYMRNASDSLSGQSIIEGEEIIFEFLLNALRLRKGFSYKTFENNTGLDKNLVIDACNDIDKELLEVDDKGIRASEKGYRYLDNILQQFI